MVQLPSKEVHCMLGGREGGRGGEREEEGGRETGRGREREGERVREGGGDEGGRGGGRDRARKFDVT